MPGTARLEAVPLQRGSWSCGTALSRAPSKRKLELRHGWKPCPFKAEAQVRACRALTQKQLVQNRDFPQLPTAGRAIRRAPRCVRYLLRPGCGAPFESGPAFFRKLWKACPFQTETQADIALHSKVTCEFLFCTAYRAKTGNAIADSAIEPYIRWKRRDPKKEDGCPEYGRNLPNRQQSAMSGIGRLAQEE